MNGKLPKRKPNRLKDYDYSQMGAYFVTICVKDRKCILWNDVVGAPIGRPQLSQIGKIIDNAIQNIPIIYVGVSIENYVIMPNHIHLIIMIKKIGDGRAMRAPTISAIINQMKGYVTKQIGYSIWQKLFHDRVIRNEKEYLQMWEYINNNPLEWQEDCYFTKFPLN